MLYNAYEMQRSMLASASAFANFGAGLLNNPANPFGYFGGGPILASALGVFAHASAPRGKPEFGFVSTTIDGREVAVTEEILARKPFGQLKHFVREGVTGGPKLLIVAPMSGHYATLLRGTVERMLPFADVYITDWRDAKLVPLSDGRFDLDDYIDYVVEFLTEIGADGDPRAHVLAVCQPSVPAYAAVSVMSADQHPNRPHTLTMMGGPIDTRQAPTSVNTLATERPHAWFQQNVIATVPMLYPGAGRTVYPGFLQLAGFMTMNLGNHMISHFELFKHLVRGDDDSADQTMAFYEEYRSVCDMTSEFYLQTIEQVFQKHSLPNGEMIAPRPFSRSVGDHRCRDPGDRGRTGRYFRPWSDKGGADAGDEAAGEVETISYGQGSWPLRHLQWFEMANPHRPGHGKMDRCERQLGRFNRQIW